ncbi:pilus assembly protein PilM [candidate division KSB1 bacterium]
MSKATKDKKELATNRLLEILRGERDEVDVAQEAPVSPDIGLELSDEERDALSGVPREEPAQVFEDRDDKKAFSFAEYGRILIDRLTRFVSPQKKLAGLEFGYDSIKYVLFEKQKHNFVLKDFKIRKIDHDIIQNPIENIEVIKRTLNELIPSGIRKTGMFATIVSGNNVSIKKISLPKMAKKELKEAIAWNANKELPFEAENTLHDYRILGDITDKGIEKTEVLVSVIDTTLLDRHLEMYKAFGIVPAKVLTTPLAIYYNYLHYFGKENKANAVIIDIGTHISNIIFMQEGNLQFAREISTGGRDITESITGTISTAEGMVKIDMAEAEKLKLEYGIPDEGSAGMTQDGISLNQLGSLMRPSLERLLTQIKRSFDYYRSKFPYGEPEKVYLIGGTALMTNFEEFIADGIGKEVEILNPMKSIIVDPSLMEKTDISSVAPTLSTTMGIIFSDRKDINLLPQELKMIPVYKQQLKGLGAAAGLMLVLMGYLSTASLVESGSVGETLAGVRGEYNRIMQSEQVTTVQAQINALQEEYRSFQVNVDQLSGNVNVVEYLQLLSSITPNYITLNSVSIQTIDDRRMVIIGSINVSLQENVVYLVRYANRLKESGMFSSVPPYTEIFPEDAVVSVDQPFGGDTMHFQLDCIL